MDKVDLINCDRTFLVLLDSPLILKVSSKEAVTMMNFSFISLDFNLLSLMRQWLESIKIHNPNLAHFVCKIIPARCPFEREVKLFQQTLFRIPPLCKLNPLYEQVVGLRFKCLCYLADECGQDITAYY
jgi:hypothetical protein